MVPITFWLGMAGGVQLLFVATSFLLPKIFNFRENLAKVSPLIRQIFIVHSIYITLVLMLFSSLSFFFAPELAGKSRLGHLLCCFIAFFWSLRVPIQLFYYDSKTKKEHPVENVAVTFALLFLASVYIIAAIGGRS